MSAHQRFYLAILECSLHVLDGCLKFLLLVDEILLGFDGMVGVDGCDVVDHVGALDELVLRCLYVCLLVDAQLCDMVEQRELEMAVEERYQLLWECEKESWLRFSSPHKRQIRRAHGGEEQEKLAGKENYEPGDIER